MTCLETGIELPCTAMELMAVSLAELILRMAGLETGVEVPTTIAI